MNWYANRIEILRDRGAFRLYHGHGAHPLAREWVSRDWNSMLSADRYEIDQRVTRFFPTTSAFLSSIRDCNCTIPLVSLREGMGGGGRRIRAICIMIVIRRPPLRRYLWTDVDYECNNDNGVDDKWRQRNRDKPEQTKGAQFEREGLLIDPTRLSQLSWPIGQLIGEW